jgi:glycerol uptake facilitator-like aquaporin
MLIEGVLTMFLVFVFFATTFGKPEPRPALTGVATGLLITVAALFGGPFTGAAMNPARVFGPALVARRWTNHGVYWVGPLAGGAAGAVLYGLIFPQHRPKQS